MALCFYENYSWLERETENKKSDTYQCLGTRCILSICVLYCVQCLCICKWVACGYVCVGGVDLWSMTGSSLITLNLLKITITSFHVYGCSACMHVYVPHTEAWCPSLKKASNPLDLKLSTVVSHHVGAGNWMKVPEKQVLFSADHLSSPSTFIFFFKYTVAISRHTRRGHQIPLQMVMSHPVVAGNWTQDIWKSSQCSQPLSHLSSPLQACFYFLISIHF